MDFTKILKLTLKVIFKMRKEDWKGLSGMLGCLGVYVVLILMGCFVVAILGTMISLILIIFQVEFELDTVYGLVAAILPLSLFGLHIYRSYINGFYDKG